MVHRNDVLIIFLRKNLLSSYSIVPLIQFGLKPLTLKCKTHDMRDNITCDGNNLIIMTNLSPASGPTSYPGPGLAPLAAAFSARGPFLCAKFPAPRVDCWRSGAAPSHPVCPSRSAARPQSAAARQRVDPVGIQCRNGCQNLRFNQSNSKFTK